MDNRVLTHRSLHSNGIMLNYCPFCGEDLRPFRVDHVKEEARE